MSHSAPLELLTDASGSVAFGWVGVGSYYARFGRCLSARLGEAFAARLRSAAQSVPQLRYYGDARELESYDLLARSAFVRVVMEQRRKFEAITILNWSGAEMSPAFLSALGEPVTITSDPIDFEARLVSAAPFARAKLGSKLESRYRSRWPLRS